MIVQLSSPGIAILYKAISRIMYMRIIIGIVRIPGEILELPSGV